MKNVWIACGVLSVLLNLVLTYGIIDNAITINYQRVSLIRNKKKIETYNTLLTQAYPKIGYQGFLEMSKDAKLDIMKKSALNPNNEEIYIGNVLFEFSKDKKLVSIGVP
jgi:hypothetical protein